MSSFEIHPHQTAFISIDLQNSIVGRELAPHTGLQVVRKCAQLAEAFRKKHAMVVYVHVNIADFIHLEVDQPTRDPKAPPPPAEASEFVKDSGRQPEDLVITKRHWSAFPGTELESKLRQKGIRTIVIGGIATNFGVESTARSAAGLGFNLIFAEDAMTSMSADAHKFAIQNIFPRIGRVRSTEQILAALK